jgi:hypothetical protein
MAMDPLDVLPLGLRSRLAVLVPRGRIVSVEVLGTGDERAQGETQKAIGYGRPIRVVLEGPDGRDDLVFHTAAANEFGHDRRSDRVAEMLLAWDTFGAIPRHVEALDVGVIGEGGALVSLAKTSEAYLVTRWAEGTPYASELRGVAQRGEASEAELEHARALARLLGEIHAAPGSHEGSYVRAWRDLVGGGEGIAGLVDGYGEGGRGGLDVPGASRARLAEIEVACLRARQRHAHRVARLTRTHGDYHPVNLLLEGDRVTLLDTSRGSEGEPADDVACLAINFLFFGLEHRERWASGLGRLWDAFFEAYAEVRHDAELFDVIAPFFAWRALVVTSPAWYPGMRAADRDRVLGFAERVLAAERFDPAMGREAMR